MDDTSPATKADIKALHGDIAAILRAIKTVDANQQKMHNDLYEADDQILTVLTNVDRRLTGKVDDHENRIVVLEQQAA